MTSNSFRPVGIVRIHVLNWDYLFCQFKRCYFLVIVSPNVCQHLWECICYHSAALLRNSAVSHTDAACERVYPLPPDPQPTQAEAGGVFSAFLELHQWHRHEHGASVHQIKHWLYVCSLIYLIFLLIKAFNKKETFAIHRAHANWEQDRKKKRSSDVSTVVDVL